MAGRSKRPQRYTVGIKSLNLSSSNIRFGESNTQVQRNGTANFEKKPAAFLLILFVILGLANYFSTYYGNQLPTIPNSTFLPPPQQTIEPALPPSQLPSQQEPPKSSKPTLPNQQEPSQSSEPTSPIIVTPSTPVTSTQPNLTPNPKLSAYSVDPLTNRFQPLTAIDWSDEGPLLPGLSRNSSRVYFRNEGDMPVTLYLSTSGWIFEDSAGRVLPQDYNQYKG